MPAPSPFRVPAPNPDFYPPDAGPVGPTLTARVQPSSLKPDRVAGLKRDMYYLRRFPHPNIVAVFGAYEEDGKLFMVMEYVSNSLRSRSVVNRVDVVRVLSDVARALVRLHAAGHVHRDVKARNVLITRGYETAKLCDFGLARTMPDATRDDVNPVLTPKIGPPKYRAPEVVKRRDYGISSDMYGFGIMCQQLVKELKKKRRRAMGEEEIEFILNLASECLRKDPAARPTAGECLKRLLEYRGRSLQLCSRETANKRRSYWIDAPMDVGTFKHAGKEPTASSDRSSSDSPSSDDARGERRGEDSEMGRAEGARGDGGVAHGDEEDEVTGGGASKRRRVDVES